MMTTATKIRTLLRPEHVAMLHAIIKTRRVAWYGPEQTPEFDRAAHQATLKELEAWGFATLRRPGAGEKQSYYHATDEGSAWIARFTYPVSAGNERPNKVTGHLYQAHGIEAVCCQGVMRADENSIAANLLISAAHMLQNSLFPGMDAGFPITDPEVTLGDYRAVMLHIEGVFSMGVVLKQRHPLCKSIRRMLRGVVKKEYDLVLK